jgi:hypothetical protein
MSAAYGPGNRKRVAGAEYEAIERTMPIFFLELVFGGFAQVFVRVRYASPAINSSAPPTLAKCNL